MKKKKGFTLIEIIAVILVLGIIIILVLPSITGSSVSTKQKAYNTKLELIKDATVMYGQDFYGNILKEEIHPEEEFKTTDICIDKQVASTIIKCTIKVDTLVQKDYLIGENGTQLLSNPLDKTLSLNEDYITLWIDTTTRKISTSELKSTVPTDPIPEDDPLPPEIISPPEPEESTKPEEPKVEIALSKIEVVTMPTKTIYEVGEDFSKRGMQIRAIYSDGSTKIITAYTVLNGNNLSNGQNQVTISYTENNVTKTTNVQISVIYIPMLAPGNTWVSSVSSAYVRKITNLTFVKEVPTSYTKSYPAAVDANGDGALDNDIMCYYTGSATLYVYADAPRIYANPDSSSAFNHLSNLYYINNIEMYDTSKVTNMSSMFKSMHYLKELDLSHFKTDKVTNMSSMFYGIAGDGTSLTLDVSKWNTSNVTDMSYMFYETEAVANIDVSKWDTGKVKNMSYMFAFNYNDEGSQIKVLDVSKWNTSNVTNMAYMFCNLKSVSKLDVSNWNVSKVTNMSYMFADDSNNYSSAFINLDVSKWNTRNVTDISYMFYNCNKLTNLDVSEWNTSNVTNMSFAFYGCSKISILDVANWNTSKTINMCSMFYNCSSITNIDLSNWNTNKVTNMKEMLSGCRSLKTIYLGSNFGQKSNLPYSGYGSGLFYSSNSINTMVYNANNSMKNYDWSSDNRTVTFKTS